MNVTVKVDADGVRRALAGVKESVSRRALTRSMNEAVTSARTEATKLVRQELNLKLGTVREAIGVRKASRGIVSGAIVIEPKDVGLIDYGARQTKAGVTVKVKKAGGRSLVKRAFIATMKSGKVGVFTRYPEGGGPRSPRLPIRMLFSTSVRQFFKRQRVVDHIAQFAARKFNIEALRQIRLALAKARAR